MIMSTWEGRPSAQTVQLSPPALRVPVPPGLQIVGRHHNQVPSTGSDRVIATGTAVLLLTANVANVEPCELRPVRSRRSRPWRFRRLPILGPSPVLAWHLTAPA